MRTTADFWSVNFLTGVRPGIPFQTSMSRSVGHSANQAGQLLLAAEALALAGLLLAGVRRDAVLGVDRVRFHFTFPWPQAAVMTSITQVGASHANEERANA
jgi:hypothetical protein